MPLLPFPPLLLLDCDVDEEGGAEVVVAPFEEGVVCAGVLPDEAVGAVSPATGMLDDPAETVEVAVALPPPAALLHENMMAETPFGPSK